MTNEHTHTRSTKAGFPAKMANCPIDQNIKFSWKLTKLTVIAYEAKKKNRKKEKKKESFARVHPCCQLERHYLMDKLRDTITNNVVQRLSDYKARRDHRDKLN